MKILIFAPCLFIVFLGLTSCFSNSTSGYTVNEVLPKSTFEKLGIQKGDRIISYDGESVNSVGDSMELYDKLKNHKVKLILIERNGEKQTIAVP